MHYFFVNFLTVTIFLLQTTVLLSEISSKSEERIAPGFSLKILSKCTGGTDELYEDQIRVMLQSGNATLHLIFPIAVSLNYVRNTFFFVIYNTYTRSPTSTEATKNCS